MHVNGREIGATTVGALVGAVARDAPPTAGLEIGGRRLSYAEIDDLSNQVAAGLLAIGTQKGDRVCSSMFSCMEGLLLWFGTVKIGAIWVPLNVGLIGEDLAYTLENTEASILVIDGHNREKMDNPAVARQLPSRRYFVGDAKPPGYEPFSTLLHAGGLVTSNEIGPEDPAVIIYTGGTTGMPKGVVLPHFAWICAGLRYIEALDPRPDDHHFSVGPMFHVSGLMAGIIGPMSARIPSTLEGTFSVSRFWDRVRETNASIIDPVGSILVLLCRQPSSDADRTHRVRVALGITGQIPAEIPEQFTERFGIGLLNLYSLTEAGGLLIVNNPLGSSNPKANGKPSYWTEVQIVDELGQSLPPKTLGNITLRPGVPYSFMLRYHNDPVGTLNAITNLWLHTGDLGYLDDDGFLYFVGRQAHWLRRRGENISSFEVESIIAKYPGVAEVAVIGVPSELGEEEVKAFIVVAEAHEIEPENLIGWCVERMATFKIPRFIEFISALPRSVTKGEIERHKLKALPNTSAWDRERVFGRRVSR